jgi:Fur family ferric uptake transcriptional regulator
MLHQSRIRGILADVKSAYADALRGQGLQVTAQRLAVLHAVAAQPHCTADEAMRTAREQIGTISRQSVYDTLSTLVDAGILRRIQPIGSPARYEDRVGDNHHHMVCRDCGMLIDVDCAVGSAPCLTPSDSARYDIDEAEVVYWGRCPACQADAAPPRTPQKSHA